MIITNNPDAIRLDCKNVAPSEVGDVIATLERELVQSNKLGSFGIGLAAPQIGTALNAAIIRLDDWHRVDLVNCRIAKAYDEFTFDDEGCLSFPELTASTKRYQEIYVVDNLVYPHSFIATGLFAVAIQHELDHLKGVLLPDIALKEQPKVKLGANEPCYCGSKVKFKRCHGRNR